MSTMFNREGPLFVNLASDPRVGDTAMFAVPEGESVVSCEVLRDQWPEAKTLLVTENGVQTPHLKVVRMGPNVSITPLREDALVYLNGQLVTDADVELRHNDRLIVGHRAAFRYCLCGAASSAQPRDSKVIDWELCCEEFATKMKLLRTPSEFAALERKVADLEVELNQRDEPVAALCLLTGGHGRQRVWNLPRIDGELVSIGSGLEISLPSLKGKVSLEKRHDHYVLHAGSTKRKLSNGSKFTVSDHNFALFDATMPVSSSACTVHASPPDHYDNHALRNAMFELQFSVLQCFRHHAEATTECDQFRDRVMMLENEDVLDSEHYNMASIAKHAEFMSQSLRMAYAPRCPLDAEAMSVDELYDAMRERTATVDALSEDRSLSDWQQHRLYTQEQLVAQQCITIASLEHQLGQLSPASGATPHSPRNSMHIVRDTVLTYSPVVAARVLQVSNAAARGNFSLCWKRYLGALTSLLDEVGNIHCIPEHFKGRVLMALVDVTSAYEIGKRNSNFTNEDEQLVQKRAVAWKIAADQCMGSDKMTSRTPSARSVSPMERPSPSTATRSGVRQPSPTSRKPISTSTPASRNSSATRVTASPAGSRFTSPTNSRTTPVNGGIPRHTSPVTRPVATRTAASATAARGASSQGAKASSTGRLPSPAVQREVPPRASQLRPTNGVPPQPRAASRPTVPRATTPTAASTAPGRTSPSQRVPSPSQRVPSPMGRVTHQSRPVVTRQPLLRTVSPRSRLAEELLKAGKPAFK